MTELIDKLLSNMSEKFNQANKLVEINLNEDKTLKWRGLHHNQYASAKRKKDGTAVTTTTTAAAAATAAAATTTTSLTTTTTTATTTMTTATSTTKQRAIACSKSHSADDPSPFDSNSSSSSISNSNGSVCSGSANALSGVSATPATDASVGPSHEHENCVSSAPMATTTNSMSSSAAVAASAPTSSTTATVSTTSTDKHEPTHDSNSGKSMDLRPFRRTLRRNKQNVDDASDDVNFVSQTTATTTQQQQQQSNSIGKKSIRSRRSLLGGSRSVSEAGSISPKTVDEKSSESATPTTDSSITTRRRGRAKKLENELESANKSAEDTAMITTSSAITVKAERKNSIAHETSVCNVVDVAVDNAQVTQPSPPKLRRSERTLHASAPHETKDVAAAATAATAAVAVEDHSSIETTVEAVKTRKRTIDERRMPEPKEESTDLPLPEVKAEQIDDANGGGDDTAAAPAIAATSKDEAIAIDGDAGAIAVPRKRGRKPGSKIKSKVDLKVNMTIATRSSPVKKSPRFSSDESPFSYSIPKRDRERNAEQAQQPQPRLSRRIKPTMKILANEELRQGFELQNNARLSNSSEHLDNESERSPKREVSTAAVIQEIVRTESEDVSEAVIEAIERESAKRSPPIVAKPSTTPPLHEASRPVPRRPCPDPEKFLHEIKMARINLHRSPEDNKKLNVKQKKRLSKLKEKHLYKLGLQRVSRSSKDASSDSNVDSDDNEEFVPAKKINVGRPSVTLRVRGQKDIVIYDKHVTPAAKAARDKAKKVQGRSSQPSSSSSSSSSASSSPPQMPAVTVRSPPKLLDRLDSHSKELISRNPEISLISSTKHKTPTEHFMPNGTTTQLTSEVTLSTIVRKESADANVCLCNKVSKYYTRKTDDTFCSAVDQIENQKVGCGNEVTGDLLNLLRPSVRVSYMLLCDSHKKRLYAHNCCAGCGMFCTQGRFVICAKNHFFHRDCATKFILNAPYDPQNPNYTYPTLVLKCPHCGIDAPETESTITMRCSSVPVFTTSQKKQSKPIARMSIGSHSYRMIKSREERYLLEIERLIPDSIEAILVRSQNRFSFTEGRTYTNKDVFYAITKDDIERMAEIIASGFDITTPIKEFHNGTCLHLVSNFGSITMAHLIMSRVTSIDFFNLLDKELRTAVMCAIVGGKNDILKLLVQCGADLTIKGTDGMTALHLAAKTANLDALRILLDNYRDCVSLYQLEKFLNASDDGGWTAIVWAADLGNADMVSALLNCGANPNICDTENNTALHWATLSDNIDTVMLFLQHGGCSLGTQNINGDTPLHISCRNGNVRISLYLLAHGANLDITNNANEAPYDCIPDENGPCGRAIFFNLQIRNIAGLPEQNIISQDISNGREVYPIQIIGRKKYRNARPASTQSDSDSDQLIPDFKYITKTILLQNSIQIDRRVSQMRICSCFDNCTTQNCQCSEISIQNWYNAEGRLNSDFNFHDPAMIFECNDVCGCNKLLCKNRVVQNGSKVALQIFECNDRVKGFGVRGLTKIPRGTFIAEYTGEILTDIEADRRTDDSYFFDLGASEHCIDANFYGNVSRFLNHSCEPNTIPIRVYFEHQDLRFPKIAFFASRDIEAGDEITFDYGEKFWIAKYKLFTCHCGAMSCRYSDKMIAKTLEEYNQRNS